MAAINNASATAAIYAGGGSPAMPGAQSGLCRSCGFPGTGLAFSQWVKPTFTDHDKLLPGDIICHACSFCFDDERPELAALVGKDAPQRMRNYSHFVVDGKWIPLSKGNKSEMLRCLLSSPDVAVVAESGQKHLIFRAKPKWWQFEELRMRPHWDQTPFEAIGSLYNLGFSKTEIQTGNYTQQKRILAVGIDRWFVLDQIVQKSRGTALFSLMIFLAQRTEITDDPATAPGLGGPVTDAALAQPI